MGSNERLILADFGLGKESIASEMKTTLGTRLYAGESTDPTYTDPSPETCTVSFNYNTSALTHRQAQWEGGPPRR